MGQKRLALKGRDIVMEQGVCLPYASHMRWDAAGRRGVFAECGWGSSESRRAGLQAHNCKAMPRSIAPSPRQAGRLPYHFGCRTASLCRGDRRGSSVQTAAPTLELPNFRTSSTLHHSIVAASRDPTSPRLRRTGGVAPPVPPRFFGASQELDWAAQGQRSAFTL